MDNLNQFIDHTLLKPEASKREIELLCKEAIDYDFKSVCINPVHIPLATKLLFGKNPLVCTVIGFPLGANKSEVKVFECKKALEDGAREIDMVLNIGSLIEKDYNLVNDDIEMVLEKTHSAKALLKVIFETSKLTTEEIIKACEICKKLEVDFIKTSTGFGGGGASIEHIKLMREHIGREIGVKASGGVRSKEDAINMISAGATRIGTSSGIKIIAEG